MAPLTAAEAARSTTPVAEATSAGWSRPRPRTTILHGRPVADHWVDSTVSAASLSVPRTWDDITPEWMSAALATDFPGVVVDAVTVELRDDGTNRRARLGVTYQAGDGPATVFVKAADPAHKALIRLTSGMFHEPRLFICGVDLPLEHPFVYTALIDEAEYDFVMVMEDLTARGADPTRRHPADDRRGGRHWRARPGPYARPVLG